MSDKETDLYEPVKIYLEELGFRVDAEVNNCDIVATLKSDIIIVELKNSFSMKLLYQAVDRQKLSSIVYVAIPNRTSKKYPPNIKNIRSLLKRLNIGLLVVHFRKNDAIVEPVLDVKPSSAIRNNKKRTRLLKELDGRYKNFNIGGSSPTKKIITSYMLDSIQIAVILKEEGPLSPAKLKEKGSSPNTQSILIKNYKRWFDRVKRGVYTLSPEGEAALSSFPEQTSYYRKKLQNIKKTNIVY